MMYRLYSMLWVVLTPFMYVHLRWRALRGKEIAARLPERFGVASVARPQGRVVWIHAASVGEAVAALALAKALGAHAKLTILITTATITAARMVDAHPRINARIIHQMQPLDSPRILRRFLRHWQVDALISMESDIWPAMILETHAHGINPVLVSAQMSPRTHKRWMRQSVATRQNLFSALARIEAVDAENADRFRQCIAPNWTRIGISGPIKASAMPIITGKTPLPAPGRDGRLMILLASSHADEEARVVEAYKALAPKTPSLLLIAPRHIHRAPSLLASLKKYGLKINLLSRDGTANAAICIADSMGQMGHFYRRADIVIMGGGFGAYGGHNPMEPAALGKGVISGTKIHKNAAIYARLDACGGVIWADSVDEIRTALTRLVASPKRRKAINRGALRAFQSFTEQVDAVALRILKQIKES